MSEEFVVDLDRDLAGSPRISDLVRDDVFAAALYAALCNTTWKHKETGVEWGCTWRSAGAIVAELRGERVYTDWYCGGNEGHVEPAVLAEINALGWNLCDR